MAIEAQAIVVGKKLLIDFLAASIVWHIRSGVIGISASARGEIHHLQAHFLGPNTNTVIVIFIRWDKHRCDLLSDASLCHLIVSRYHVRHKLLLSDKQRVAVFPRHIEEMAIAMGTQIMAMSFYFLNVTRERIIEQSRKEESAFHAMAIER